MNKLKDENRNLKKENQNLIDNEIEQLKADVRWVTFLDIHFFSK